MCLVLITPASGERPWVQFEAGGAYFGHKRLSLLHSSAKSPPTLPNDPTLIESDEEVAQLIDAIRADLKLDAIASTARTIQAVSRFIAEAKAYNPEYAILHCENRLELQIGYGDVLEWPGPGAIALACDDRFDLVKHEKEANCMSVRWLANFEGVSSITSHWTNTAYTWSNGSAVPTR